MLPVMTIEQKPELNRFVDSSIPITWSWRWRQLKFVLPIWCFIWVCYIEMGILTAWLRDKLNLEFAVNLISMLLIFTVVMWTLIEILVRFRRHSKRVLRVEEKRIVVSPAKNGFVPWKNVARLQFEPISELSDGRRLIIFLRGFKKQRQVERPFWMIVLEQASQVHELVSFLEAKRNETGSDFEIVFLNETLKPPQSRPFPFLGMSFFMGGIYFLLHGIPLLGVALEKNHNHSDGGAKTGPHAAAIIKRFVLQHFSNTQELNHFILQLSISLIFIGLVLFVSGTKLMGRKSENLSAQI
jgi:hypothetical protein